MDEAFGADGQPHEVEGSPHRRVVDDVGEGIAPMVLVARILRPAPAPVAGEQIEGSRQELVAAAVERGGPRNAPAGVGQLASSDCDLRSVLEGDRDIVIGDAAPVLDRSRDDRSHSQIALDGRHRRRIAARGGDPGEELAWREEHDIGLAQAREHLFDVVQKCGRWSDDEDAVLRELVAVGVEEPRCAVQRDDGLAGARAALDDGDLGERAADDGVLVCRDGRDDVAHPALTWSLDRSSRGIGIGGGEGGVGEDLIFDMSDGSVLGDDAAPALDAHRIHGGRLVEARGVRCPPVEQHRVSVLVAQADPADMKGLALIGIESAEAQPRVSQPSGLQLMHEVLELRLALELVLDGTDGGGRAKPRDSLIKVHDEVREGDVCAVQEDLLVFDRAHGDFLRLVRGRQSWTRSLSEARGQHASARRTRIRRCFSRMVRHGRVPSPCARSAPEISDDRSCGCRSLVPGIDPSLRVVPQRLQSCLACQRSIDARPHRWLQAKAPTWRHDGH